MLRSLPLAVLLAAVPARAEDWLASARASAAAAFPDALGAEKPKGAVPYETPSRLFRADLPSPDWLAFEEEDALGTVTRVLGPEDPSGALRAALSVRLMDRDSPAYVPIKAAVDAMRRQGPDRECTAVSPLRVSAGLARTFEITRTARVPPDSGPAAPMELHQFVAVIPRGDSYFVVRLTTTRASYLDYREVFLKFLKSLKPVGAR